jgi:ABC-type uncharacterized transport system substrate-binding protein
MIAKDVVGRDFDLILTVSTPVLQAVANANLSTKRRHVFSLTTDPWGAGIGISRENHHDHPPYMTGYGTLQPVEAVFQLARQANPKLARVGVVWNPSEANSEASTKLARQACKDLDIELIEVTVDTSAAVSESAQALVNRGVEAIWAGGDSTVSTAFDALIAAARSGRIPVFTNMPSDVKKGSLFSLGADYYEVGRWSGLLAARVLRGEDPAKIPVENYLPEQLAVNRATLEPLGSGWTLPAEWLTRAEVVVDASGVHQKKSREIAKPAKNTMYKVAALYFGPNPVTEVTLTGLKARLRERGFEEGKNLVIRADHAHGDISLIPSILQKLDESDADLIVTFSTPCLTAASSVVKNKPVVFTEVYDPIAAGAGTSVTDHRPHVTGVGSFPPLEKVVAATRQLVPNLQSVGAVYNSSEANSRKVMLVARELLQKQKVRLEEVTVANSSEVLQAAQVLAQKKVDILWEIGDNTVSLGLEGLVQAAVAARLPVVGSDASSVERGTLVGVGISFYHSGYAAGDLVARVLLGAKTADIPFEELAQVHLSANLEMAKQLHFDLPTALLKECSSFHGVRERFGRPARIALVQLSESPTLDAASDGVLAGLREAGLTPDHDFVLLKYSAQGDMSQLPLILANVKNEAVDLIITSTTPAMIAAARTIRDIPIVFTVASYPPAVGVFPEGQRQNNVVGVYDDPPISDLIELALKREGTLKKVGTVWNPAEPNSEISVKKLRQVCQAKGLELIERHAAAVSELPNTTASVCQAGAQIIVISADNITSAGLPAILSVARESRVPVYSTEPDMVRRGATAGIGDNFFEWGRQTARMSAKVLAGVPPAALDFEKTAVQHAVVAEDVRRD